MNSCVCVCVLFVCRWKRVCRGHWHSCRLRRWPPSTSTAHDVYTNGSQKSQTSIAIPSTYSARSGSLLLSLLLSLLSPLFPLLSFLLPPLIFWFFLLVLRMSVSNSNLTLFFLFLSLTHSLTLSLSLSLSLSL